MCMQIKPEAIAVSLTKGMRMRKAPRGPQLISQLISTNLNVDCSVLMGANVAADIGREQLSEATLGFTNFENAKLLQKLFQRPYFLVSTIPDVVCSSLDPCGCVIAAPPLRDSLYYNSLPECCPPVQEQLSVHCASSEYETPWVCMQAGAEMAGTLKNVVAVAAGFIDGLGYGSNTKAAIMREGLSEMRDLSKAMFPSVRDETFLESCGVADLIATCFGGRNRAVASEWARLHCQVRNLCRSNATLQSAPC